MEQILYGSIVHDLFVERFVWHIFATIGGIMSGGGGGDGRTKLGRGVWYYSLEMKEKVAIRGNVCPAHARRATFVLSILSLAPGLSSPQEVPQVDRTTPQTFRARHLA